MSASGDLLGIAEIAALARVNASAVGNWRIRFKDFPQPIAALRSGPVFSREQVSHWLRKRRGKPMGTNVIATINLKGGVAKTTTTVALAEMLAGTYRKKVLVIDLDPQTNATVMLLGEDRWKALNGKGLTLARLFQDALEETPDSRKFDFDKTLQRGVSDVNEVTSLDLLPSSLDLIDVQDKLGSMSSGRFHSNVPTDILRRVLRNELTYWDYVLIDCPPNLGIITLNGLRLANGYIIPTIPDVLSTYGIPQILTRVHEFADIIGSDIDPLGIIVSKYDAKNSVHKRMVQRLRADEKVPRVFDAIIPQRTQTSAAAEFNPTNTLKQKYGYAAGQFEAFDALTREFIEVVEGVTV